MMSGDSTVISSISSGSEPSRYLHVKVTFVPSIALSSFVVTMISGVSVANIVSSLVHIIDSPLTDEQIFASLIFAVEMVHAEIVSARRVSSGITFFIFLLLIFIIR